MRLEGKSLKSDFLRFIIPSIIAQWVFSLYTMVDGIFVARGVSEVALTAVNISMPFTTGLFSISILFAVGNSTIVAILLGQGEKERANEVFTQNVVLLCTLSVLITILVIVFLEPFARFLGATDNILSYAKTYIGTIAPFSMVYILSYSFETLIKTDGYPKLATIYVTSGSVLNCILDYNLVMVLHKGVWGGSVCYGNLAGSSDPLVSVAFPRTERNDKIFEVPFDAVRNLASDSQWYVVRRDGILKWNHYLLL